MSEKKNMIIISCLVHKQKIKHTFIRSMIDTQHIFQNSRTTDDRLMDKAITKTFVFGKTTTIFQHVLGIFCNNHVGSIVFVGSY